MIRINTDEIFYIDVLITGVNGKGVSGLEVNFSVRRSSDDKEFFNSALQDVGKGCYKSQVIFSEPGQYRLLIEPPEFYEDILETIIVTRKPSTREIPRQRLF